MAKPKTPTTINPNDLKSRDELMVRLINGATKSGPQKDRKKDRNKRRSRSKIPPTEDE